MWNNNKKVTHTYTSSQSQNCYAIFNGISGWKKIKTGSTNGVSNVFTTLNAAKAGNRTVNVYLVNNVIERIVMS